MKLFVTQDCSRNSALVTFARGFALPLVLLLLCTQFVSGMHEHHGKIDHHHEDACPVCVHASAPAIGADDAPSVFAPSLSVERPRFLAAVAPVSPAPRLTASRGPPLA